MKKVVEENIRRDYEENRKFIDGVKFFGIIICNFQFIRVEGMNRN